MLKWEYLFVYCDLYEGLRVRSVNGKELADWTTGPKPYEYANRVGEEGWELVALDTCGAGAIPYQYRMVFKRPKP